MILVARILTSLRRQTLTDRADDPGKKKTPGPRSTAAQGGVDAGKSKPEPRSERKIAKAGEPFPIVGIGMSAGGLEVATAFLKAMPPDSGMGLVIVQHLDPTRRA